MEQPEVYYDRAVRAMGLIHSAAGVCTDKRTDKQSDRKMEKTGIDSICLL